MTPEELGEAVDRVMADVHDLAQHAPTMPIMSDLDMALMYLRHAQRQIPPERSTK